MPTPHHSLPVAAACHRCTDAPRQKSHAQTMCQASSDPALPATRGAHIKPRAAPEHGPVLDLRTAKEQRRARERLRSMSAMQAEVPMPSPRCDAGANLTGWRHSWDEVVEFTFTTVEDECREETAVPKTQIAGLALSYLCRYLTLAEDDSLTGGGGGTQGWSTGAAASGRRPAGVRNRSDPGEIGSSTLASIMAAFKHLAGVHPSFDDHFCKLWPAARLTKARPRSPSPPPSPPRALAPAPPALTPQRARTYAPCAPAPPRPGTRALARPLTRLTPRSPLPPGHAQGARAQAGADAAGLRPLAPPLTAPPHPPATPRPAVPRFAPPRLAAPGAFCSAPAAVTHPAPLPSAAVADAPVLPHAVHGAG